MNTITISPARSLKGELTVPGDKSISHRAVMFSSIARGDARITGFLKGADCLSTIGCFRAMGIDISVNEAEVIVKGAGLRGLKCPENALDAGNSGTTVRLMSGILAAQDFDSVITGDASIRKRPMKRIIEPLRLMGAGIRGKDGGYTAPLIIEGAGLKGISYDSPVSSAQVKSCLLLAGLYAEGETSVTEPVRSRDHTERMLRGMGAELEVSGNTVRIRPAGELCAPDIIVPGDISSAAYFIAAALLLPGSSVLIKNVGINPTRDGILKAAGLMGGHIERLNQREAAGEPVCDLLVHGSELKGTVIGGDIIPTLIDEIPVIAVMAAAAEGETVIKDAAELKVKETDRIMTVTENLKALGIKAEPTDDGMVIQGGQLLKGTVKSFGDHRIAMAFSVAALAAEGPVIIEDPDCVDISFPGFFSELLRLAE